MRSAALGQIDPFAEIPAAVASGVGAIFAAPGVVQRLDAPTALDALARKPHLICHAAFLIERLGAPPAVRAHGSARLWSRSISILPSSMPLYARRASPPLPLKAWRGPWVSRRGTIRRRSCRLWSKTCSAASPRPPIPPRARLRSLPTSSPAPIGHGRRRCSRHCGPETQGSIPIHSQPGSMSGIGWRNGRMTGPARRDRNCRSAPKKPRSCLQASSVSIPRAGPPSAIMRAPPPMPSARASARRKTSYFSPKPEPALARPSAISHRPISGHGATTRRCGSRPTPRICSGNWTRKPCGCCPIRMSGGIASSSERAARTIFASSTCRKPSGG